MTSFRPLYLKSFLAVCVDVDLWDTQEHFVQCPWATVRREASRRHGDRGLSPLPFRKTERRGGGGDEQVPESVSVGLPEG